MGTVNDICCKAGLTDCNRTQNLARHDSGTMESLNATWHWLVQHIIQQPGFNLQGMAGFLAMPAMDPPVACCNVAGSPVPQLTSCMSVILYLQA